MILPITVYGHPSLRAENQDVDPADPQVRQLVDDMFETMYNAQGVGLAAPQVDRGVRVIVIDGSGLEGVTGSPEDVPMADFKRVLLNPQRVDEAGAKWSYEEGCLSIPGLRESVQRHAEITLAYQTPEGEARTETFKGLQARIVQHEYDHLEGVLFVDHLSPIRRQLIKNKLLRLARGTADADYPLRFATSKAKP